ncbi:hypothetical protein VKT23_016966 [Stygiomarasmius scandens]|uniref:Uncharacterized protein n=1 Tax=Marasmiellus scandens TaxID=2682957 RepID=A0ABR1IVW0_9AGAR
MGQRHQVFLIARLVPCGFKTGQAYYRCIGAHHHQWCYGTLPLAALHRFISLIKNPNNAEIVRDEIRRAQGAYGRRREDSHMHLMPCPYTLLLLSMAWNAELGSPETAYASGGGFECNALDPNMGSFDGHNNDGITVIDVTDPADPAYCFVRKHGSPPIDGKGYIGHYYDFAKKCEIAKSDVEGDEKNFALRIVKCVANLDDVRLLTAQALAEAWPKDSYGTSLEDDGGRADSGALGASGEGQVQTVPSLTELTLAPVLELALDTNDTEELEEMVWMPGKADLMKKVLMKKNPLPGSGMSLLAKILAQELVSTSRFILDLSMLPFLSSDQVGSLVKTLSSTSPGVKSLNLSGNHNISIQTVSEVLLALPELARLVLLDTSIANDHILKLMFTSPKLFYNLYDLVHPAFLRATALIEGYYRPLGEDVTLHPAYIHGISFVTINDGRLGEFASVPIFHPEKLLKTLARHVALLTNKSDKMDRYFTSTYVESGLGPLLALSTGTSIVQAIKPAKKTETGQEGNTPTAVAQILVDEGIDGWNSRSVISVPRTSSLEGFLGLGWVLVLQPYRWGKPPLYGFVKVDREALGQRIRKGKTHLASFDPDGSLKNRPRLEELMNPELYKIHDVKGFLKEMEMQGRPVPSEDTVSGIVDVFEMAVLLSEEELESALFNSDSAVESTYERFWDSMVV